ncbi:hypothetical protein WG904_06415 [Pedobacter sp. Du54]|uniref:hypothetical protein n=1 Tax=Pedobacter anseongensis TaxID=3133439 RepID=UPI00309A57CA
MKKFAYLIIALLISTTAFAQKTSNKQKKQSTSLKTRFFVDEKEADHLVAKLIDPKNYASMGISGISPGDIANNRPIGNKQKTLRMVTKPNAKFMNLDQFFEHYKVPVANQQIIKVNGDLLSIRENFLANENRIGKVELNTDNEGKPYVNIISKVPDYAKNPN